MTPVVRLVAVDLDGTILEGGEIIRPDTIDSIRRCRDRGVQVVTASGRPHAFQLEVLARHGLDRGDFAALICDERELWIRGADGFDSVSAWNEPTYARWHSLVPEVSRWVEWSLTEARRNGWPAAHHFSAEQTVAHGLGVVALEQEEAAVQLEGLLRARLKAEAPAIACNRNKRLVQLHDVLVDKARSLAELARLLGVDARQVLAIGDSGNDRSMLDGTHGFRSATVANASTEVKEAVVRATGTVASKPSGAGVAAILDALVRGQAPSSE
ncbi:HAD family hydrolase [Kribbella sp. WER1]